MPCARHSKRRRTVSWRRATTGFRTSCRSGASGSSTTKSCKQGFQLKGNATVHRDGEPFEKLGAFLRDAGVDATPHAAVQVSVEEAYLLDPGPNAGKRVL
jgi:hypothetical protein